MPSASSPDVSSTDPPWPAHHSRPQRSIIDDNSCSATSSDPKNKLPEVSTKTRGAQDEPILTHDTTMPSWCCTLVGLPNIGGKVGVNFVFHRGVLTNTGSYINTVIY